MDIDVVPTAEAIEAAAEKMRKAAVDLDNIARRMREKNDLIYAGEAIMTLINVLQQARPDLFVIRPLRVFGK